MAPRAHDWALAYVRYPNDLNTTQPSPSGVATPAVGFFQMPISSRFSAYASLEGLAASVIDARLSRQLHKPMIASLQSDLISYHEQFLRQQNAYQPDYLGVSILWHLSFMSLFADFDLLERAIGRDGASLDEDDAHLIAAWAASVEAKRCVVHGLLIQKELEKLSLGAEPAIHVPRAMFLAAICWYCYSRYGTDDGTSGGLGHGSLDFPEVRMLGANPTLLLFEANGYKLGRPTAIEANGPLCGLTDLLQRIGHWEIARKFAAILGALIHNEADQKGYQKG